MGKKAENKEEDKEPRKGFVARVYPVFVDLTQRYKALTVMLILGLVVLSGYVAVNYVPVSFFPPADKTQFVIDVLLPYGYDLRATDEKVKLLEEKLARMKTTKAAQPKSIFGKENPKLPLIKDYAVYVGRSGPRFFIAVIPQPPKSRMAHIMVTTPQRVVHQACSKGVEEVCQGKNLRRQG